MKNKTINKENDFPGYPLYKPEEDITNHGSKIEADVDKISDNLNDLKPVSTDNDKKETENEPLFGENDVTAEDLKVLGRRDQDMDDGEDETLIPLVQMNDQLMGGDLDVPGNDYNDPDLDPEDEENNLFSNSED